MLTMLHVCAMSLCVFGITYLCVCVGARNKAPKAVQVDPIKQAAHDAAVLWLELNKLKESNDPLEVRYELRKVQTEHAIAMVTLSRLCGLGRNL